jgi:hypothetical protein
MAQCGLCIPAAPHTTLGVNHTVCTAPTPPTPACTPHHGVHVSVVGTARVRASIRQGI